MDQAWKTLTQSLKVGDLSTAQTALDDYTKSLSTSNVSMSAATTPSDKFLNDLQTLGNALKAGSLVDARTALASAKDHAPFTAAQAVYWAESQADLDGWITVYSLTHPGSSPPKWNQLTSDITGLDSALREMGVNLTDALVALGYSQSDAETYSTALTGISNGSSEDNANLDAARSEQWKQELIGYAKGDALPAGYANASDSSDPTLNDPMFSLLSSVVAANSIGGWRQLQTLINYTLNAGSSGGTEDTSANAGNGSALGNASISIQA
jgi:hypothetical protein